MKMIRDRADARWLPQRHRFALTRLIAYAMFHLTGRREEKGIALGIDRDQASIESHSLAVGVTVVSTLFAYALLSRLLLRPVAALLAPLASTVSLQVILIWAAFAPRSWRWNNHIEVNSFLTLLAVAATALYFAADGGWIRYVAWFVIGVYALNAIAAIVAFLMKRRFDRCLEEVSA